MSLCFARRKENSSGWSGLFTIFYKIEQKYLMVGVFEKQMDFVSDKVYEKDQMIEML